MLAGVGLDTSGAPDASLRCPEDWSARGAELLGHEGPWLGLNPGAFFGTAKRWIPERYAAVGDLVSRRTGTRVAILGGPAERPLGEAIAAGMRAPVRVLCGETTLPDLVGVLSRLRLLVTNDSGPMHVAAALEGGGARFDAIYVCPHHPSVGEPPYRKDCDCRKPRPGMLRRAEAELGADLARSWVVGDRHGDLQLAWNAGARAALVQTGYGRGEVEYEAPRWRRPPDLVAAHLLEAVERILAGA